ncbi:MAG: Ig-like domain-containing protein [Prevotella sp.]|nr:Ig-like domain-containing protein [Prevotella sp.]
MKAPAFATRGDGAGTSSNPYKITNLQDLQDLSESTSKYYNYFRSTFYYQQTNDIDGDGAHIVPIGYSKTTYGANFGFYWGGHYNGNGKTISNIVVDNIEGDECCGLFNCMGYTDNTDSYVKNLPLSNSTINGGSAQYVGALVGQAYYGTLIGNTVKNCRINKNSYYKVGVLAGTYSSSNVTVSNNKYYSNCQIKISSATISYGTGSGANGIGIGNESGFRADVTGKFEVIQLLKANFYYNSHLLFTLYAPGEGGVVDGLPTTEEMLSTYGIQDAAFTYGGNPFTAETVITDDADVTISGTLNISSIGITASKTTLSPNETGKVTVSITPVFADYTLTSSKTKVATVAQNGDITYVGPGTTTITATADDDPSKTATIDITYSDNGEITIGNNTSYSSYDTPYRNYSIYSTTQQLYTPAEIGPAGDIRAIAFKVATSSSFSTSDVKIYLGHKSGTFSSSSDYVPSGNLTLVYAGSPTLGSATGWEKLEFNQNGGVFEYNGTDNLVVVICKSASSYNGTLKYYYTSKSGYALYRGSDGSSSYAVVSNTSYSYYTSPYRPSAKF